MGVVPLSSPPSSATLHPRTESTEHFSSPYGQSRGLGGDSPAVTAGAGVAVGTAAAASSASPAAACPLTTLPLMRAALPAELPPTSVTVNASSPSAAAVAAPATGKDKIKYVDMEKQQLAASGVHHQPRVFTFPPTQPALVSTSTTAQSPAALPPAAGQFPTGMPMAASLQAAPPLTNLFQAVPVPPHVVVPVAIPPSAVAPVVAVPPPNAPVATSWVGPPAHPIYTGIPIQGSSAIPAAAAAGTAAAAAAVSFVPPPMPPPLAAAAPSGYSNLPSAILSARTCIAPGAWHPYQSRM